MAKAASAPSAFMTERIVREGRDEFLGVPRSPSVPREPLRGTPRIPRNSEELHKQKAAPLAPLSRTTAEATFYAAYTRTRKRVSSFFTVAIDSWLLPGLVK